MAKYFVLSDKDKAAFINQINKFLKQIDSTLGVDTNNFKDVPSIGEGEDLTLFMTASPWEEKVMDVLQKNKAFDFKVKEVNPKDMFIDIKESLGSTIKKAATGIALGVALAGNAQQTPQQKRAALDSITQIKRDDIKKKKDSIINRNLAATGLTRDEYRAKQVANAKKSDAPLDGLETSKANKRGKTKGSCTTGQTNKGDSLKDTK
jgi:hypothetical protein